MKRRTAIFSLAAIAALSYFAATTRSQPPANRVRPPHPEPFASPDGRFIGWKITIPGHKPLATPAVVDGKVFVGGGFGSHEFYAFNARTGEPLWVYRTADDGPTAAVVEGETIIFNTESCELETITTDGRPRWKKWLGDPLMSMPAVADGAVYMAYPASRGDHQYYLAAFDLESGRELWKHPLSSEIITAPIIEQKRVYVATVDGKLASFNRASGEQLWIEARNVTSAPAVSGGQCYFSRREQTTVNTAGRSAPQQNEVVSKRSAAAAAPVEDMERTMQRADYLDYAKRKASYDEQMNQELDSTVGFATSKGSAKMYMIQANLGQASVHGVWAYQGSKPFIDNGLLYSSMADKVMSVDPITEKVTWTHPIYPEGRPGPLNSELTPPAIVNGKIFVGTRSGDLLVLSQKTGALLWKVNVGEPIAFQPAVSRGRVYISTIDGSIICIGTRDALDDGWLMWGATGSHNGLAR